MSNFSTLPPDALHLIELALAEDVGPGDVTSAWTVPAEREVSARVVAKEAGVLAGVRVAEAVFHRVGPTLRVEVLADDGTQLLPGERILGVSGPARAILTAERTALNFLQRLSGVATLTRAFVAAVAGTGVGILDTRKTTPGMRALEKAAVRAGGGINHRFGLHDMVLIKENHVAAAGGLRAAVAAVRRANRCGLKVEVETRDLDEVAAALDAGVDRILLDNMTPAELREAVQRVRAAVGAAVELEASGGVDLRTVRSVAETGVDFVSVGALTHSAPALDLSLLVDL